MLKEGYLVLAFVRNVGLKNTQIYAHKVGFGCFFLPAFKYFSDLAKYSLIMNPLKEAWSSSEHIGLTIFPQAFDLWNVSPLLIFR